MRILRISVPHTISILLLLERLEGALKENPQITTKDLCRLGLCPAHITFALTKIKAQLQFAKAA